MKKIVGWLMGIHLHKWETTYGAFGEPLQRSCKCGATEVSNLSFSWVRVKG
jgi:hypothetical protein